MLPFQNQFLAAFGDSEIKRLSPDIEHVRLTPRLPIEHIGIPFEHVYFPENGVISVVAKANGKTTEIGLIGREGLTGISVLLGDDRSSNESYVQVAGDAWRIGVPAFREILAEHPNMHLLLLRYVQTFLVQTSQTALSNSKAKIEERLARWLLMVHDRDGSNHIEITHEFLATMIGTRRPGVTEALHGIEGHGLIRAARGRIVIVDRKGLEELANSFYGLPEAEYRRIITPPPI